MLNDEFECGDTVFIKEQEICEKLGIGKIKTKISGIASSEEIYTVEVCEKVNCDGLCGFAFYELLSTRIVLIEKYEKR